MRGDDRSPGEPQDVEHGLLADVGDIDKHAQPVHFSHDLFAEGTEAAVEGSLAVDTQAGIANLIMTDVGEGDITDAPVVKPFYVPDILPYWVSVFHPDDGHDFSLLGDNRDLFRVKGDRHVLGHLRLGHAVNPVDLFQGQIMRGPISLRRQRALLHVGREKGPVQASGLHGGQAGELLVTHLFRPLGREEADLDIDVRVQGQHPVVDGFRPGDESDRRVRQPFPASGRPSRQERNQK